MLARFASSISYRIVIRQILNTHKIKFQRKSAFLVCPPLIAPIHNCIIHFIHWAIIITIIIRNDDNSALRISQLIARRRRRCDRMYDIEFMTAPSPTCWSDSHTNERLEFIQIRAIYNENEIKKKQKRNHQIIKWNNKQSADGFVSRECVYVPVCSVAICLRLSPHAPLYLIENRMLTFTAIISVMTPCAVRTGRTAA